MLLLYTISVFVLYSYYVQMFQILHLFHLINLFVVLDLVIYDLCFEYKISFLLFELLFVLLLPASLLKLQVLVFYNIEKDLSLDKHLKDLF